MSAVKTSPSKTFVLELDVARELGSGGRAISRATFYEELWREFSSLGLLGVHEGTLLSERASELGLETESWTVDSGKAPRERDWVGGQGSQRAELYFSERAGAEAARAR